MMSIMILRNRVFNCKRNGAGKEYYKNSKIKLICKFIIGKLEKEIKTMKIMIFLIPVKKILIKNK